MWECCKFSVQTCLIPNHLLNDAPPITDDTTTWNVRLIITLTITCIIVQSKEDSSTWHVVITAIHTALTDIIHSFQHSGIHSDIHSLTHTHGQKMYNLLDVDLHMRQWYCAMMRLPSRYSILSLHGRLVATLRGGCLTGAGWQVHTDHFPYVTALFPLSIRARSVYVPARVVTAGHSLGHWWARGL